MKESKWFLRIGDDYLEDAVCYRTKQAAVCAYREVASELHRYGQAIQATLHIAPNKDAVVEYPDYVLSMNEHGRVVTERA